MLQVLITMYGWEVCNLLDTAELQNSSACGCGVMGALLKHWEDHKLANPNSV